MQKENKIYRYANSEGIRLKSIFESLLFFGIMGGLLLPARLLFVEYVSDDWLGSVGVISIISISIIILAKKEKLGFFGPILERQIFKFQKGKRGVLVVIESIILLTLLGGMIFAIEQGNSNYSELKLQNDPNFSSNSQVLKQTEDWKVDDWFNNFLIVPYAMVTAFPQMSAAMASIDQEVNGWILHIYTVGFVEYAEILVILIFYKLSFRKKMQSFAITTTNTKDMIGTA